LTGQKAKNEFINLNENVAPPFSKYNSTHANTKSILEYWKPENRLGGGPLTRDLSTVEVPSISTPYKHLIDTTKTYGLYHIQKVRYDYK